MNLDGCDRLMRYVVAWRRRQERRRPKLRRKGSLYLLHMAEVWRMRRSLVSHPNDIGRLLIDRLWPSRPSGLRKRRGIRIKLAVHAVLLLKVGGRLRLLGMTVLTEKRRRMWSRGRSGVYLLRLVRCEERLRCSLIRQRPGALPILPR